jgi:uncharacterized protein YgiM (DUF1202 family)
MKFIINLQKTTIATVMLLTGFATSCTAASIATRQLIQPVASKQVTTESQEIVQIAQTIDSCRRVSAVSGLNVYQEASINSSVIGNVVNGRYVTIINRGINGWVPISAPLKGYISAANLVYCQSTSPSVDRCRQVAARGGLNVRREPSVYSSILGIVANGRYVTISNRGANGWVPISVPLNGYVSSAYLKYCPQAT